MLKRVSGRGMAIAVAVILLLATFFTFRSEGETRTVSAHFDRAVQLFKGSEVRIMGVNVGYVKAVVPEGNSVRVDMEYDAQYKVPDDAKAVIITPTLTADRFVQLTPAYTSGPVMATGADIPLARTGSPVELDRIYTSLDELSTALGPNAVNKNGSLDTLLNAGSRALEGQGAKGNEMLVNLSEAVQTFGDGSGELFETVRGLQQFTTALARNDEFVGRFIEDLAGVSSQLASERTDLRAALDNLASAVGQVERFVRNNKGIVESDIRSLTKVSTTLARQKENIAVALEKAPLGLSNLHLAYDVPSGSIGSRFQSMGNINDIDGFLCTLVKQSDTPNADLACKLFSQLFEPILGNPGGGGGTPGLPNLPTVQQKDGKLKLGAGDPAGSLGDLLGARR